MQKIRSLFYVMLCLLLAGCWQKTRLERVLEYSAENRSELEKVLDHYSHNPADSLKLQAAIFLIENMPGHYTFGGRWMEEYCAKVDTVKDLSFYQKKILQIIPFTYPHYRNQMEVQEDVKHIRADFLIHNIELAFRQWESRQWGEMADFETFKEYLLPYRIENEPLDAWRDSLGELETKLKEYTQYYDDCRHYISYIEKQFSSYDYYIPSKAPVADIMDFQMECIPTSKLDLFILRLIGIPSTIDFTPDFANRNGRHYWATAVDQRIKYGTVFQSDIYRMGKIYRRTYSHNPTVKPSGKEYVPPFFLDPFNKDVTSHYMKTADVMVDKLRGRDIKHAYLAVFNEQTWKPIACGKPWGKQFIFRDMGKDIVYLPVYYNEEAEMCALDDPLIVYTDGRYQTLKPRHDSLQCMVLSRKYPNSSLHARWYEEMEGCRLEASDKVDFKQAVQVFRKNDRGSYRHEFISVDTTIRKRYWRFGKDERGADLADLHFYNSHGKEIKGKLLEIDSLRGTLIVDDNPLTIGYVYDWATVDFGEPVAVSQVRFLGRNDANGIYPDNEYELFYYDKEWISLGRKTSTGYELEFDRVPTEGLYWLRNLTEGQEERIFTWENGKPRFW